MIYINKSMMMAMTDYTLDALAHFCMHANLKEVYSCRVDPVRVDERLNESFIFNV